MIKNDRQVFSLTGPDNLTAFLRKKSPMESTGWMKLDTEIHQILLNKPEHVVHKGNWHAVLTRSATGIYRLEIVKIDPVLWDRETIELAYEIKAKVWEVMPYLGKLGEMITAITNLETKQEP